MRSLGIVLLVLLVTPSMSLAEPVSVAFRFTAKSTSIAEATLALNATSCLLGGGRVDEELGIGANMTEVRYGLNGTGVGFVALNNNYSAGGVGFMGGVAVEFEGSSGYSELMIRATGSGRGTLTAGYWAPDNSFVKRILEGPYEFGFELEVKPIPKGPMPANVTRACPVSPV